MLTHGHADHAEGAELLGAPVHRPGEGERGGPVRGDRDAGPLARQRLPGVARAGLLHAATPCWAAAACSSLRGRGRCRRTWSRCGGCGSSTLEVLCPGHGPYVWDPAAKLDEYIAHRLDRERRLVEALDAGLRTRDELLDAAWSDAPAELRYFAGLSLASHLEKLAEEGRLPEGVERPG